MSDKERARIMGQKMEAWKQTQGTLKQMRDKLISSALDHFGNNTTWAARALGISVRTVRKEKSRRKNSQNPSGSLPQ